MYLWLCLLTMRSLDSPEIQGVPSIPGRRRGWAHLYFGVCAGFCTAHFMVIRCLVFHLSVSFAITHVFEIRGRRFGAIWAKQVLDKKRRSSRQCRRVALCDCFRHLPFLFSIKSKFMCVKRVGVCHAKKLWNCFFKMSPLHHVLLRWSPEIPNRERHAFWTITLVYWTRTVKGYYCLQIPALWLTAPGGRRIPASERFIWVN